MLSAAPTPATPPVLSLAETEMLGAHTGGACTLARTEAMLERSPATPPWFPVSLNDVPQGLKRQLEQEIVQRMMKEPVYHLIGHHMLGPREGYYWFVAGVRQWRMTLVRGSVGGPSTSVAYRAAQALASGALKELASGCSVWWLADRFDRSRSPTDVYYVLLPDTAVPPAYNFAGIVCECKKYPCRLTWREVELGGTLLREFSAVAEVWKPIGLRPATCPSICYAESLNRVKYMMACVDPADVALPEGDEILIA